MGLSEVEIEARLALLRRRREALDREIADLVLYLELGRRLGAVGPGTVPALGAEPAVGSIPADRVAPDRIPAGTRPDPRSEISAELPGGVAAGIPGAPGAIPPAVPFAEDPAGARRYGRRLMEAACAAIAEAGRPLHAAEILAVLVGRGFTVPGRDPVAALNTRLWKRAGPDGLLRRVGEATYDLAAPP